MNGLEIRRAGGVDAEKYRPELLALYAEIYADRLDEEFRSVERFAGRLGMWARAPGFAVVIGYVEAKPIGYAYGCPLSPGARWWSGLRTPVAAEEIMETGSRTFALSELMVDTTVRGTGAAKRIHDALLRDLAEERVTLLVDREHPRVRARYEEWGYRPLGEIMPFPDSPVFDAMVLPLR